MAFVGDAGAQAELEAIRKQMSTPLPPQGAQREHPQGAPASLPFRPAHRARPRAAAAVFLPARPPASPPQ